MTYFNKIEKIVIATVVILFAILAGVGMNGGNISLSGSTASQRCDVSTVTRAEVGNQGSIVILSASSNRAWARIQQPNIATNTVALSFDEGAAATLTSGITLPTKEASTTSHYIEFGLGTNFPYTGAVTGITNIASATVEVIECNYTS